MCSLHNKTVHFVSLDTPRGCMGECPCFHMKVSRTGAIAYHGVANVEIIGRQKGRVNYLEFDSIANVIETSGFLDLSEEDDGDMVSTIGKTQIGVELLDGRKYIFTRDAMNEPPIFWAIARLMTSLLEKVEWGDDKFNEARAIYDAHGGESIEQREQNDALEDAAIKRGFVDVEDVKNGFALCPYCRKRFPLYSDQFWDGEKHLSCRTRIRLPHAIRDLEDRGALRKITMRGGAVQ